MSAAWGGVGVRPGGGVAGGPLLAPRRRRLARREAGPRTDRDGTELHQARPDAVDPRGSAGRAGGFRPGRAAGPPPAVRQRAGAEHSGGGVRAAGGSAVRDRKRGVAGKSVSGRVDLGGRRSIKKKKST